MVGILAGSRARRQPLREPFVPVDGNVPKYRLGYGAERDAAEREEAPREPPGNRA
jgi:hypothetical protein